MTAAIHFLRPADAHCGCHDVCEGHQPTPSKTDRRTGYRDAAELLDALDSENGDAIAQLLRACADLCIPADHPSRPNPHHVIASLLAAADKIANALLPEDDDDCEEPRAGHA